MRTLFNLHQFRLFCCLAEKGSVALAAKQLFITPSALSVQVRRFEESLGVQLFTRGPGGMALTPAGALIYDRGIRLLEEERYTQSVVEQLRNGTATPIRIGVTAAGALYFVAEWLKRREADHLIVDLDVDMPRNLLEKLDRGMIDMVIDFGPYHWRTGFRSVLKDEFVLLASPRYRSGGGSVISAEAFMHTPYVSVELTRGSTPFVEAALLAARLPPAIRMRVPSIDAAMRCVEANLGVTFAPLISAAREIQDGRLRRMSVEAFSLIREIGLIVPPEPRLPQTVAALAREIRQFADRVGARQATAPSGSGLDGSTL